MDKITAEELLDRAWMLRRNAIAESRGSRLDEGSAMWIVSLGAWRAMLCVRHIAVDYMGYFNEPRRNTFFGLPVRLTIEDEPGTPPIDLVMRPALRALPDRPRAVGEE